MLLGLAASGWIAPWLAVALLVAYLLLSVNIALAASSRGTFKISYGLFGGTELRILLALVNVAVLLWPTFALGGHASSMVGGGMAVFAAAAASETEGRQRLIASGIGAVIAAFPFALVLGLEGGGWAAAWGLRAVFFFFPLVFGSAYLAEQLPKWLKSSAKA
jgi:hypothetical protein